ncbi:MAG: cytochrome b/b6 domain-containing protein [Crocinitomicaceae bacterium]|nr:cytochrome b/b6 domain-containing protein [Crocinitomicaceae bacterium]
MKNQTKFTPLHRLLHWIMALAMIVLYITGFLRMHWMNKNHIVGIIQDTSDLISKEEATVIAKTIREPMWQWHELFAHVMIISFLVRILYVLIKGIRFPNPFKAGNSVKERLQGLVYVYFYLYLFVAAFTGICMEKELLMDWKKDLETVHKLGLYLFPIFIVLHFTGIIMGEYGNKKGIVSKMIGGEKN